MRTIVLKTTRAQIAIYYIQVELPWLGLGIGLTENQHCDFLNHRIALAQVGVLSLPSPISCRRLSQVKLFGSRTQAAYRFDKVALPCSLYFRPNSGSIRLVLLLLFAVQLVVAHELSSYNVCASTSESSFSRSGFYGSFILLDYCSEHWI